MSMNTVFIAHGQCMQKGWNSGCNHTWVKIYSYNHTTRRKAPYPPWICMMMYGNAVYCCYGNFIFNQWLHLTIREFYKEYDEDWSQVTFA